MYEIDAFFLSPPSLLKINEALLPVLLAMVTSVVEVVVDKFVVVLTEFVDIPVTIPLSLTVIVGIALPDP